MSTNEPIHEKTIEIPTEEEMKKEIKQGAMRALFSMISKNKSKGISILSVLITITYGLFYFLFPQQCTLNAGVVNYINSTHLFNDTEKSISIASAIFYYGGCVISFLISFLVWIKDNEQKKEKENHEGTKGALKEVEKQKNDLFETLTNVSRGIQMNSVGVLTPQNTPRSDSDKTEPYEDSKYPTPINLT